MDTMTAFMMGQANRGREKKVFDWRKAAEIICDRHPRRAVAGLQYDLANTSGTIYEDGHIVEDDYTYLASVWANPVLILFTDDDEEEEILCYRMAHEVPNWDAHTKWPESSLKILNTELQPS